MRRRSGNALVESALIWPLVVLVTAALFSHGLEETALIREALETHGAEREGRVFDMPGKALSLSSLPVFSEAFSSGSSE